MHRRWIGGLLAIAAIAAGGWLRALPSSAATSPSGSWWPWNPPEIATLYFSDGAFLYPVSRRLPSGSDGPRAALEALLEGPRPGTGLTTPIPRGVHLQSLRVADGFARVDLSAALLGASTNMGAARLAIVETLTALPGVRQVEISVDGRALGPPVSRTPLLYFASAHGLAALPASARTPRQAIAEYVTAIRDPALTGVPRDVRLLDYQYDAGNGLVSVDFSYTDSIRTLALENPAVMRSVLLGVAAGLTEFPDVRAVRIAFEGRTRLGLGECSDLLGIPQPRPRLLNDERLLGS
jgi:spore germination protein GerM